MFEHKYMTKGTFQTADLRWVQESEMDRKDEEPCEGGVYLSNSEVPTFSPETLRYLCVVMRSSSSINKSILKGSNHNLLGSSKENQVSHKTRTNIFLEYLQKMKKHRCVNTQTDKRISMNVRFPR